MATADSNDLIYTSYGVDIRVFIEAAYSFFGGNPLSIAGTLDLLGSIWTVWTIFAFILSGIFMIGYIYATIRFNQVTGLEAETIKTQERLWEELYGGNQKSNRWQEIQNHLAADSPNDWRIAIIEADVMLEDALEKAGFPGNTIGERLKSASPETFTSLDAAWNAHKVRNQVAHAGADFVLTKKVAKETLLQYQRALTEFGEI